MALFTKDDLFHFLDDGGVSLALFLANEPYASSIKWRFEQKREFDLDAPVLQSEIDSLRLLGAIGQASVSALFAENGRRNAAIAAPVELPVRRYQVALLQPQGNINLWLATQTVLPCRIDHKSAPGAYMVTTTAVLATDHAADVQEVL